MEQNILTCQGKYRNSQQRFALADLQLKLLFQASRMWAKFLLEKGMFVSQVGAASWCWGTFSETCPRFWSIL